jgi:hypothetical protein
MMLYAEGVRRGQFFKSLIGRRKSGEMSSYNRFRFWPIFGRQNGIFLGAVQTVNLLALRLRWFESTPAKSFTRAAFQLLEPIRSRQANINNLLSLYPITSRNRCAELRFLTQVDTNLDRNHPVAAASPNGETPKDAAGAGVLILQIPFKSKLSDASFPQEPLP